MVCILFCSAFHSISLSFFVWKWEKESIEHLIKLRWKKTFPRIFGHMIPHILSLSTLTELVCKFLVSDQFGKIKHKRNGIEKQREGECIYVCVCVWELKAATFKCIGWHTNVDTFFTSSVHFAAFHTRCLLFDVYVRRFTLAGSEHF